MSLTRGVCSLFVRGLLLGIGIMLVACQPPPPVPASIPPLSPPAPPLAAEPTLSPALSPTNSPSPAFTRTSIPATSTHTASSLVPSLTSLKGDLWNQVAHLETNMPRPGSEGFVVPMDFELAAFGEWVVKIEEENFENVPLRVAALGYELIEYTDRGDENAPSYFLREKKPIQRGWGLYVFRAGWSHNVIVEAPHPLSDNGTPSIALEIFRALDARALLIAGAHRDANSDQSADMAHNPQTIFQTIHQTLLQTGTPVVLQIHGFAADKHPGYPQVVLGSAQDDPSELLTTFAGALTQAGLTVGVCDGVSWDALCGETNVQASTLKEGIFIHLELAESVRAAPQKLIEVLVGILRK